MNPGLSLLQSLSQFCLEQERITVLWSREEVVLEWSHSGHQIWYLTCYGYTSGTCWALSFLTVMIFMELVSFPSCSQGWRFCSELQYTAVNNSFKTMVHAVSCDLGIMIYWLDSVVPYPVRQLVPPGTLHKKNCLSDHNIGSMICSVILSVTNLFVQFFCHAPLTLFWTFWLSSLKPASAGRFS